MFCPHCNQSHLSGASFCPVTGNTLDEYTTCPQCGEKIQVDWKVCAKCGYKLVETNKINYWKRSNLIWLLILFIVGGLILFDLPSLIKSNSKENELIRITLRGENIFDEDLDSDNITRSEDNNESINNDDYDLSPSPLPTKMPVTETDKVRTSIVIYTAKDPYEVAEFIPVAQAALPAYTLDVLSLSTSDLTARLLAEKDNPQADVIWGTAVTSLMIFMKEGMLEPYAPKGWEGILSMFKDDNNPPYWVGIDGYVNAVICNKSLMDKKSLSMPQTWEDLLDPAYEDSFLMPNPASSSIGFMFVSSILQGMGEDAGFDYLRNLDRSMVMYTKSGLAPARMAATGEFPCSISFALVGANLIADGAPVEMVVPRRTGWDMEANALMNGANNPAGAKAFLDWAISNEAFEGYSKYSGVLAKPGFDTPPGIPADIPYRLFSMDFTWSMENRERILAEWLKLFEYKVQN